MLCYNCMREKGDARFCPFCGCEHVVDPATHHLPAGTVIGNRYTLGKVLGEGGFGITYIGYDHTLDILVAIKEYFPYGISHRVNTVSNTVSISAGDQENDYEKGKSRFLSEAKNVARFRKESGIVTVFDFIEENNTAYIVMEYLDGVDLRNYLRQNGTLSVEQTIDLMMPVIKSLDKIHAAGVIHRDISPDNLMVLRDGSVKLMDFGAAREFVGDERSMSVMLKKGYAPEEQYRSNGKQGPWTDIYGICATMYRCITGKTPVESLDRIFDDPLQRPSALGVAISPQMEAVLMYGLAVRREDRCQTMAELSRLLNEARFQAPQKTAVQQPVIQQQPVYPDGSQDNVTQAADNKSLQSGNNTAWNSVSVYPPVIPEPPAITDTTRQKKKKVPVALIVVASIALVLVSILIFQLVISLFNKDNPTPSPSETQASVIDSDPDSDSEPDPVPNPGFTVAETDTYGATFQSLVDYLYSFTDSSAYKTSLTDSSLYPLSDNGCYLTNKDKTYFSSKLAADPEIEYDCSTNITVEDKVYAVGTTTLKTLLNDGWKYADGQSAPKANNSLSQLVNLELKGEDITVFVDSTGSDAEEAVIQSFYIDGPAGFSDTPADFKYHDFVPGDDAETAYQKAKPSEINFYSGLSSGTIEYTYDATDSHILFKLEFNYDASTDTSSLYEIHVSYYS